MKNGFLALLIATAMTMGSTDGLAQDLKPSAGNNKKTGDSAPVDHSQMDHGKMDHGDAKSKTKDQGQMDHGQMDHGQMDHSKMKHDGAPAAGGHGAGSTDHGRMQGGSPPPDARNPHAYSNGYDFGPYSLRMADQHNFYAVLFDNLEWTRSRGEDAGAYDVQAWFGRDYDRLVLKAEGEVDDGKLHEARTELLWSHALAAFWNGQLGVRHDRGEGPNRAWLAFGVQGLAPYWFELDIAAYVGEAGHTALRFDAEYEILITQRLILQPRLEANFYGKRDIERELGSGLSDLSAGLRLRYEITRQFAPYIGVEWTGLFGRTEDFARAAGADARRTSAVMGVRMWY